MQLMIQSTIFNMNHNRIQHEQDYIEFLERRVKSANFKKKVSPSEYEMAEKRLKKARLVLRMLEK